MNWKRLAGATAAGLALAAGVATFAGSAGASSARAERASSPGYEDATLTVADNDLDTLLPAATELSFFELDELWAPLVAFNPNGTLDDVQAQSITAADHDKVWTIRIRPGWTFDNGEPVTAQSYVDGWNLTAYKGNAYPNASELSEIAGYSAVNPLTGKATAKTLSGLKVLGTDAFQVTLTTPDSQFPVELSSGNTGFFPMPQAGLADLKSFATDPIGDGPYEMDGVANLNEQVPMKAYPGYKGVKPHVEYLTFKLFSSLDTAYTATQAGNVDVTIAPQDKYSQLKANFGSRVLLDPGESIDFLGLPLFAKSFQNIKLREAISYAIDRPVISKALLGGVSTPADGILAPGILGGGTDQCSFCSYDPAKARSLLAAAGGWSGPMVVAYPGGVGYDQEFQAIANELSQNLGIASVRAVPSSNFSAYFASMSKDQFDDGPFRGHWGVLYPSAENILASLFLPGASFNDSVGGYTSPKVTADIEAGDAAPSTAVAEKYYQAAAQVILNDAAVIPLFYPNYPFVYAPNVENLHALPHEIGVDLDAVTLK
ncbi:MAG TPA: ABC transporter substrate-binding protein [Acidimicrobiales bacterium]|nr:ABC transporter substrate-binding protein [Acidimicrobiales bacterium]